MARAHLEFIHAQHLPWLVGLAGSGREDVRSKCLSFDPDSGAMTVLIEYPEGWRRDANEACDADEEFLLLDGELEIAGVTYGQHDYAFLPAGWERSTAHAPQRTVVLAFFNKRPGYNRPSAGIPATNDGLIQRLDTIAMHWDNTNVDPNIDHLRVSRKNLRLDPEGRCRTYMLAGMPHGYPVSGTEPLERHPHDEEMFMISGDMSCGFGVMRAGAYFYRPANIWHGLDCSLSGFLLLMRTPGSNATICEWSTVRHPVVYDPPHKPILTPATTEFGGRPLAKPVLY